MFTFRSNDDDRSVCKNHEKKNATFPLALTSVKRGRQVGAHLVWTWLTAAAAAAVETH